MVVTKTIFFTFSVTEGILRFLEDMNLNPSSRTVLIIAWKFKVMFSDNIRFNVFHFSFFNLNIGSDTV